MNEFARNVVEWLSARAVYLFVLFCIAMGAGYQFVNSRNVEGLPLSSRLFSQFVAVLFVGILAALSIEKLHWNAYVVSVSGIMGGMGADKLLRLILKQINDSSNLGDFFRRFWAAYNAVTNKSKTEKP